MFTLGPPQLPFTEDYWRSQEVHDAIVLKTRQLSQQMSEYYRLEIRLPLVVDKPRDWKLEVVDASGKVRRDVEVLYPRRLMPCSAD